MGAQAKAEVSPIRMKETKNNAYCTDDKGHGNSGSQHSSRRNSNLGATSAFDTKLALTGDDLLIEYAERITKVLKGVNTNQLSTKLKT